MNYHFEEIDNWAKGWVDAFRNKPIKASLYTLGIVIIVVVIPFCLARIAGCGTPDNKPPVVAPLWERDENGDLMPAESDPQLVESGSSDRTILPPTWISIPGNMPFLDGQCSLQVQRVAEKSIFLSLTGGKWIGYTGPAVQIFDPSRRDFMREGRHYAVNVITFETNRVQCSVHAVDK